MLSYRAHCRAYFETIFYDQDTHHCREAFRRARHRALTLGGFTKHDEYFESDEYVCHPAVGHLLEIEAPEEYDVKRGKWSFAHLPVIPPHFDLKPIDKTKIAAERVLQADQAQGRDRLDQRLRRRAAKAS